MSPRARLTWTSAPVLLALLLAALVATPAFADDGAPPADPAAPTVEGGDVAAPGEADAAVSGDGEIPQADATPPPDLVATAEPAPTEAAAPEAEPSLEVPDGTTIVVVSEDGEALPLATEEAAEILATGDPIWCPATVATPVPLTSGCTASYGTLSELLGVLTGAQPAVDGVIWIEWDFDSSVDDPGLVFNLDGDALTTWRNYKLTIKGGWNGLGTNTINPIPSEINAQVSIVDWLNDIALSDLWISGVAASPALQVTTTGKVTLTRVHVRSNTGSGAVLDNDAGTADMLITLGDFCKNTGGTGLYAVSRGTITLAGVIAESNGASGAYVSNAAAAAAKNVVMTTGGFDFNSNGLEGLAVYSRGAISLKDVTATGNSGEGVRLDNTYGAAVGVTLTGTNVFAVNGSNGLMVLSNGAIKANRLIAIGNAGYGVRLENSTASSAQSVTLTASNEFKWNQVGLVVLSRGAITLANLIASYNQVGEGAYLQNDLGGSSSNVTLTGANVFNENYTTGLSVLSGGSIVLSNVTADGNLSSSGMGARLDNSTAATPKPVTLSGTNHLSGNAGYGLFVLSKGAVSLSKVTADGNQYGAGAYVANTYAGPASPQNVTMSGAQSLSENYSNGLVVFTYGTVTLANVTASSNGWGDGHGGANISQAGAVTPKAVTLTGTNTFDTNGSSGLEIIGRGAITVNNLHASFNGNVGAYLGNNTVGSVGAVAVNGTSLFDTNGDNGLEVWSLGNIILQNFDSNHNVGIGVMLYNDYSGGAASVTVGTSLAGWCNGMLDNEYSGIEVFSKGVVSLSNLCAQENGDASYYGYGIYVDNHAAATAKAVTLKGLNRSQGDYSGGIYIYSRGPITAAGLSAIGAVVGDGVLLNNTASGIAAPQPVTLTGHNDFTGNYDEGLEVVSYGAIAVGELYAGSNGAGSGTGDGAYLDNWLGAAVLPRNVTLSGTSQLYGNAVTGLRVNSLGAISVSNLTAEGNGEDGARLFNDKPGAVGGVTLTGTNGSADNDVSGLSVGSYGPIAVSNLSMEGNGGNGAYLQNNLGTTAQPVTISGTRNTFSDNDWTGLWVESKGAITVSNLDSQDNDYWGAMLKNYFGGSGSPQKVTVSGFAVVSNNGSTGLEVESYGAIAVTGAAAIGNGTSGPGNHGVDLDNWLGAATIAQPVTLSGTNLFRNNAATGLLVESLGTITASNLFSDGNGSDGVRLSNDHAGSVGGIVLTGTSTASNNGPNGFSVDSYGTITVSNLTASGNDGNGALLRNSSAPAAKPLTISGTLNTFSDNGWTGLWAESKAVITVSKVISEWNDFWGAVLDNTFSGAAFPQNVTVNGFATVNDNGRTGLEVKSFGAITVSSVSAAGNGLTGIPGHGAFLDNATGASVPKGITLNGTSTLSFNAECGLRAQSLGLIKANNLTAITNGAAGAELYNQYVAASAGVTLTGTNLFEDNVVDGLSVISHGAITLKNIIARGNGFDGAYLQSYGTVAPVTLSGTNTFLDNGNFVTLVGSGLEILADGPISVSNLIASWNADRGAVLDNYTYWTSGTPGITLTGISSFVGNNDDGLYFNAMGLVTLNNITSDGNGGDGVHGETDGGANVVMVCGSLSGNGGSGWYLKFWTPATATLKGIYSYFNGSPDYVEGGMVYIYRTCP